MLEGNQVRIVKMIIKDFYRTHQGQCLLFPRTDLACLSKENVSDFVVSIVKTFTQTKFPNNLHFFKDFSRTFSKLSIFDFPGLDFIISKFQDF